jgi:hypothetical protein
MAPKKKRRKMPGRKKKARGKRRASKKKLARKKIAPRKRATRKKRRVRGKSETVDTVVFEPQGLGARAGGQSGDLQGLSGIERAGSESVEELVEEGNAFEAEVLSGVENVRDADEEEVTTHEVPEDDVPPEYRDRE